MVPFQHVSFQFTKRYIEQADLARKELSNSNVVIEYLQNFNSRLLWWGVQKMDGFRVLTKVDF